MKLIQKTSNSNLHSYEIPIERLYRSREGGSGATSDASSTTAAQLFGLFEGLRYLRSLPCTALPAGWYFNRDRKQFSPVLSHVKLSDATTLFFICEVIEVGKKCPRNCGGLRCSPTREMCSSSRNLQETRQG